MIKKIGFTLAETMIVFLVIGVITTAAIHTFKPFDKGIKYLYSNTYYVLDRALYNATISYIRKNEKEREPFMEGFINSETNKLEPISEEEGARRLCKALIEYINPVDRAGSCTATPPDASGDSSIFEKEPMFIATNGIRFWISKRYPENGDENDRTKFFIIYADLNGSKRPNTMAYAEGTGANNSPTQDPDIFAFAALATGRICPIGVPEVESRYLTTRVVYHDQEYNKVYSPSSIPLIAAKAIAWGYYNSQNNGDNEGKDNIPISAESPLSYNGYVKSVIEEGSSSHIYDFLGGKTMRAFFNEQYPEGNKRPKLNSTSVTQGGFGCIERSDGECEVLVDKYLY